MVRGIRKKKATNTHISHRAAGYLHDGVDRIAVQGERLERRLQDGVEKIDHEAHRVMGHVKGSVGEHPWMAVGGSVALGFIFGLLSGRGIENHREHHHHSHRWFRGRRFQ
ncbi:MAG: hypothetical protein LBV36_02745 [Chromatiales bacterium]|jgi:ElaB/YqjD/DUF883 family membrane-anchored ribosome-binding protein|nr:hypothetical protein [Chromatiales bacterium]